MTAPLIAAAIVADKRATRFGDRDKSRLIVEDRTIIVRQIEELRRVTEHISVVANDPGLFADLGCPVHRDAIPGVGAIGGIYTAVRSSPALRVLVVACDLPFLDARVLRRLADLAADADGAWIRTDRGVEPLLACYQRAAADRIAHRIDAGELRAASLDAVLRMAVLDEETLATFGPVERLLANVNTPEDHARVQ